MPEQAAPGGQEQDQQDSGTESKQQPPWERDGEEFDAERAWNLIQNKTKDYDSLKTRVDTLSKQLQEAKTANLAPDEKVIAEAKELGRSEARRESGRELASTTFDALAGRRNADFDTAKVLEFTSLDKFVADDGQVDKEAIARAVESLIPAKAGGTPDFEAGQNGGGSKAQNMNDAIRTMAGHSRRS